jgi:hypothetical protein
MNNNYKKQYNTILSCLLFMASTGICFAEPISGSAVIPFKTVLIKFGITMGSVLLSIIVIWAGLKSFKEYINQQPQKLDKSSLYGDTLETPKSVDDAVISFIDKNRL